MTANTHRTLPRLALIATLALLGGCLYRMPVQQGNMLDDANVAQLQTGMTPSQVMYLLGTPMVPNAFNGERWDYYHYLDTGRRAGRNSREIRLTRRLTVWFKDGKVDRFEDDAKGNPAATPSAADPAAITPSATPAPTAG